MSSLQREVLKWVTKAHFDVTLPQKAQSLKRTEVVLARETQLRKSNIYATFGRLDKDFELFQRG